MIGRQRYLPCEGTVCFSFLRKIHCHFFGFMVIYLLWLRSLLCINPAEDPTFLYVSVVKWI